jgi:hypothetical protein
VVFDYCGQENAFYDPQAGTVVVCGELLDLWEAMAFSSLPPEDAEALVFGSTLFVLFHELGHAFIDQFDLPILGGEEDAADRFATVLLAGDPAGALLALVAAANWLSSPRVAVYWDEHPLNEQRFFNITCLVYGSNPSRFQTLVPDFLPADRAARCPSEWEDAFTSWQEVLGPYLK